VGCGYLVGRKVVDTWWVVGTWLVGRLLILDGLLLLATIVQVREAQESERQ
jgi:hypothetical protein